MAGIERGLGDCLARAKVFFGPHVVKFGAKFDEKSGGRIFDANFMERKKRRAETAGRP